MLIYINGRFLSQRVTGVQRYARELVKGLDDLLADGTLNRDDVTIEVLIPPQVEDLPDYHWVSCRTVGTKQGHLWEQWDLPRAAGGELLLNLGNTAPLLKKRQVVTIHDVSVYAVPDAYSIVFQLWYKLQFNRLSRSLSKLITVSEFSKREMVRYLKTAPSKIQVTYEGREHIEAIAPDPSILERAALTNKSYVLAVSSLSPHKNFGTVVKALDYLTDLRTLGGDYWWGEPAGFCENQFRDKCPGDSTGLCHRRAAQGPLSKCPGIYPCLSLRRIWPDTPGGDELW